MPSYKKAINFDLDTKLLEEHYPTPSFNHAYRDIRRFMESNGFKHRQGSGYVSNSKMANYEVKQIIKKFTLDNSWFSKSVNKLDVTNIGNEYSLKEFIDEVSAEQEKMVDDHLNIDEVEDELEL